MDEEPDGTIDYYTADVTSWQDYYAFGMLQPGRNYNSPDYRFGFGSHEKDDEWRGATGSDYDFGGYGYDALTGRRKGPDPLAAKYPGISPYATFGNNPILFVDPFGQDWWVAGADIKQEGEVVHQKGDVVFEKGTSEVPLQGEWERLGEDLMFGEEAIKETEYLYMSSEAAGGFMEEHGYKPSTREALVEKTTSTAYFPEPHGPITIETDLGRLEKETKTTYVKEEYVRSGSEETQIRRVRDIDIKTMTVKETTYSTETYEYGAEPMEENITQGDVMKTINKLGIPWEDIAKKVFKKIK